MLGSLIIINIHFQEAYASLFLFSKKPQVLGNLDLLYILKKHIMALFFPLATSSVGESKLIIHFQEAYAWLFYVPLATYSVGDSELIIHFQEAYTWLFSFL